MMRKWYVVDSSVVKLPAGALPYTHAVHVRVELNHAAFREQSDGEGKNRQEVLDWCTNNCSMPALIGGYELVCFQNEEDALLFYMAFKR